MSGEIDSTEQGRLARLAALGVPMVQPDEPGPDIVELAARIHGRDRASLVLAAEMHGVDPEAYAWEIVWKSKKVEPTIDQRYIERAQRGWRCGW